MQEYDYVIVGAGSAGCVLAARFAERSASTLLLEARPPDAAEEIRMPAATPALWTSLSRNDRTVSQPRAGDRRIPLIGGHVLGGGSSINGMVYIRGNAYDYDGWRDEYGCHGWGHADLLPYFRRAEDRLGVEDLRYRHPLGEAWLSAAIADGLPVNADFNGAAQDGAGYLRATMRGGRRRSAADAYPGRARREADG